MIIFGLRGRVATVDSGAFFCPRCSADRTYEKKGVRRWFTLFFVPIIPVSGIGVTRIVCSTCEGAFTENVLNLPTTDTFKSLYVQALRRCAAAVLNAGEPQSAVARTCAIVMVNGAAGASDALDDASLDDELRGADPSQLAVYVSPIANRLDSRASEQFFSAAAQIALADGELSPGESDALRNLGVSLNLSAAHQLGIVETLRAPVERPVDGPRELG